MKRPEVFAWLAAAILGGFLFAGVIYAVGETIEAFSQ